MLASVAERDEILFQRAVYDNYMADGMQMAARGHTGSAIGFPCRYSHSSLDNNARGCSKCHQIAS
ncbi:MAG: hypothetical protein EAX81_06150 [Candidatus Thorarchaeota archaeon]|nr:hypothetical protein [Candidatus Thorarchaeota archaeon]